MRRGVYLDSAATTLEKPRAVAAAVKRAVNSLASPGRGGHAASVAAAEEAYLCREAAARLFNVREPENIVFTMNATHALNIAVSALVKPGMRVLVSGFEHNSVMRPLHALGADVVFARGELFEPETTLFAFETRLAGAGCVIINHASNVFGFVLPAERITKAAADAGIPVIIDASQSAGTVPLSFAALGADFVAMPGHKGLYGPQGTGILLCRKPCRGILHGGTGSESLKPYMPTFLPDALEAGTHNMPGIAGLRRGIEFVLSEGAENIRRREVKLALYAETELRATPGITVFGGGYDRDRVGVLSFLRDGTDCETFAELLSERGFAVRAGLHCAPEAHRTAGTLETGTVRMSVSAFTSERGVERFVKTVKLLAAK
ncbi:MAG: aminotransferase class V-fold PLP-dependent enzyme [Oscillospiraceae bacterium]|nr:aminotransferase class V-fold PLP-dependent enzyme [Oscillospiraceae bacterium]